MHVGFIMDGNGRWAKKHGLDKKSGYVQGLKAMLDVTARCAERGVEEVTVFAYSTENVGRPKEDSAAIFDVIKSFNLNYDGDMRVKYIGDERTLSKLNAYEIERRTASNKGMKLNIAAGYGAQADILRAARACCEQGEFSEEVFRANLSSAGSAPLDLVVRTGGEKRLSNFMLFEAAYAELIFLDKLWGDMTADDVDAILKEFDGRVRKFGR